MPASRRRSISPPTQLRKADLGTQEFRQSKLIRQSRKPYKFSGFSVLSVDKKKILIADQWKKSTPFFRIKAKKKLLLQ